MIFSQTIFRVRDYLEKRSRYARMASEIEKLSERDLADMRGDRAQMLHHAYLEVFG